MTNAARVLTFKQQIIIFRFVSSYIFRLFTKTVFSKAK